MNTKPIRCLSVLLPLCVFALLDLPRVSLFPGFSLLRCFLASCHCRRVASLPLRFFRPLSSRIAAARCESYRHDNTAIFKYSCELGRCLTSVMRACTALRWSRQRYRCAPTHTHSECGDQCALSRLRAFLGSCRSCVCAA